MCVISCHEDEIPKLELSTKMGDVKLEYSDEIQSFQALSPQQYQVTLKTPEGYKTITKCSGFNLQSFQAKKGLSNVDFKSLLNQAVAGEKIDICVDQVRRKRDSFGHVKTEEIKMHIRNKIYKKKVLLGDFKMLPFGYTDDCL